VKALLLIVVCLSAVSCAEYSGATYAAPTSTNTPYYAGNGDASGAVDPARGRVISEYKAKTFMTDLKAGKFGPKGSTIAGQNQSKVPLSAIRTAGTIGVSAITNGMLETINNNATTVELGSQATQASIAAGKEATKQLSIQTGAATEALKIAKP
jgi:hypothetical protein